MARWEYTTTCAQLLGTLEQPPTLSEPPGVLSCWGPWSSRRRSLSLLVEGGLTWTPCPTDPVLLLPQCSDADVRAQDDWSQVTQSAETPGQGSLHVRGVGG